MLRRQIDGLLELRSGFRQLIQSGFRGAQLVVCIDELRVKGDRLLEVGASLVDLAFGGGLLAFAIYLLRRGWHFVFELLYRDSALGRAIWRGLIRQADRERLAGRG